MSTLTAEPSSHLQLRSQAEVLLKKGTAPPTAGWTTGAEALVLLHRLASAPESASDALKLLHELQVHQVELDLQHESLEQGRQELTEQLDACGELYEFAPFGYCTLDLEGRIILANRAGATLLGAERDGLIGRPIGSFLAAASQPQLTGLLARVPQEGGRGSCEVMLGTGESPRACRIVATVAPGGRSLLVGLVDAHLPPAC